MTDSSGRGLVEKIKQVKYNLFNNNCHLFSASCICGEMIDGKSWGEWLRKGTFSIDRLEAVISEFMNGGRPIAWLGVRSPSPFFKYALADDKIERLHREGKV